MLTFTDKEKNITFERNKPTVIANGVTRTMSGGLGFLPDSQNEHLISFVIITRTTGEYDMSEEVYGTYSILGSTLIIVDIETGRYQNIQY